MSCRGYTLIELLVVISIIGILSMVVFVNFKGFSQDQVLNKGILQIQNALRFAQTNATTGVLCGSSGGTSWSTEFELDETTINILCEASATSQKTFTLENVVIDAIKASSCNTNSSPPFIVTYSPILGTVNFGKPGDDDCLTTNSLTVAFTLKNPKSGNIKTLTISKGGATDVQ